MNLLSFCDLNVASLDALEGDTCYCVWVVHCSTAKMWNPTLLLALVTLDAPHLGNKHLATSRISTPSH
ncbi:hypothetical protein L0F63_005674, partial [Massospora cicadina]